MRTFVAANVLQVKNISIKKKNQTDKNPGREENHAVIKGV